MCNASATQGTRGATLRRTHLPLRARGRPELARVSPPRGKGTFPIVFGYISYQIRILMTIPACILKDTCMDTCILTYLDVSQTYVRILHALLHSKRIHVS